MVNSNVMTWGIATLSTAGVICRPFNIPEAVWAVAGALALVLSGLIPVSVALSGAAKGYDVYLFLTGMMLLAEIARQEGLFEWLAARAASMAKGSATRLFSLIYVVGIIVTVFLSNDATAVVLTPAVAASARAAKVKEPLPYLLICAFIANAASFVLPISNPANLVIYGHQMPPLLQWIPRFALPSFLSIATTFTILRFNQRQALSQSVETQVQVPRLQAGGKTAAVGIVATAMALMGASGAGFDLGLPTFCAGALTLVAVLLISRAAPFKIIKEVSWGVLPLVAGLFVLVEALDKTGVVAALGTSLHAQAANAPNVTAAISGVVIAIGSNIVNNLPAGLVAGLALQSASAPESVTSAVLIGVDLGPNLSVTGSLATILWLTALRRDGIKVNAWDFFKLGLLVMPPALLLALTGLFVFA